MQRQNLRNEWLMRWLGNRNNSYFKKIRIMKNIFLGCLLLGGTFPLLSQSKKVPIYIAYFSQLGIQPGAKIATEFSVKEVSSFNLTTRKRYVFISPQIGFFTRPNFHTNLLVNAEIGVQQQKEGTSTFSALSLGLGYLHEFRVDNLNIQLGDGNQSRSRTNHPHFLPTINYTFGNRLNANLDWYSKIGVGQRIGGGIGNSATILLEIGLKL